MARIPTAIPHTSGGIRDGYTSLKLKKHDEIDHYIQYIYLPKIEAFFRCWVPRSARIAPKLCPLAQENPGTGWRGRFRDPPTPAGASLEKRCSRPGRPRDMKITQSGGSYHEL